MPRFDAHTALVVVDIQNDFADPAGGLSVSGGAEVVSVANRLIAAAIAGGALVVYSQDWHPQDTPHFQTGGGPWPVHCVAGTWGAEFAPGLDVRGEVIRKGVAGEDGYSAFSVRDSASGETRLTSLHGLLSARGIRHVVVVGLATDYCVKATALDAVRLGYHTTVLQDAVRAVDLQPGDGEAAFDAIRAAGGRVARSDEGDEPVELGN